MGRLVRDLPAFVRSPIDIDRARARIARNLGRREERFLEIVDRFGYARSAGVYGRLLRNAGLERGDLAKMVAGEGLDGALGRLADAGIRLSFDELAGRRDVVRGSLRIAVSAGAFDNPFVRAHYAMYSGGSGGWPRLSRRSLQFTSELADQLVVALDANGVARPTSAVWFSGALNRLLTIAKLGGTPDAWFLPVAGVRWATRPFAIAGSIGARLGGLRLPMPVLAESTSPTPVLDWIASRRLDGRPLLVNGVVSACVRLAQAAVAQGVALDGVTCLIESEPVTSVRREAIEGAGARVIVDYSAVEASGMAYSCPFPSHPDDAHVFIDRYAIIQRPRDVGGETVSEALAVTTLSDLAPTILVNAELGDAATVSHRNCGCPLESLGLGMHLSGIRSFEKLTGEGVTFSRHGLISLVEQSLPDRFGGGALDYQVVEWETDRGIARLDVRIAPSIGAVDESAVLELVLTELARGGLVAHHQADLWRAARTVAVKREAPLPTPAGKLLPFRRLSSRS